MAHLNEEINQCLVSKETADRLLKGVCSYPRVNRSCGFELVSLFIYPSRFLVQPVVQYSAACTASHSPDFVLAMDNRSEVVQREQLQLIVAVKQLLQKEMQLQQLEAELCNSVENDAQELANLKSTFAGLKERLTHCHAAMDVLQEIIRDSSQ